MLNRIYECPSILSSGNDVQTGCPQAAGTCDAVFRTVITAESEPEQVKAAFSSTAATEEQYTLCLFGIVPIKTVSVQTITAPSFVPCGQPFGIKLHMDGVMVVGFGNVTSTDGTCCPAEDAGFQKGDMIHAINTVPVNSSEEVQASIRNAGSEPLSITIHLEGK